MTRASPRPNLRPIRRSRAPGLWQCAIAALTLLPLFSAGATPPATATTAISNDAKVSEQEVKAAILYRAAKFIDWPTQAFTAGDAPFVVCVVGDYEALHAFSSIEGRTVNGHRIAVRRVTGDALDLRQCHAVFFPANTDADIDYALSKLQGMPVLTVGETENFSYRGGIMALVTHDNRVRFALNLPASKHAGLTISSQLLQLATVVGKKP